jgi:hypothetical protein
MVGVVVRDHDVVDPFQAGLLSCVNDPVGIAEIVTGPSGVDQQRLAGGRHNQSRLPSFDVDEIDLKALGRVRRRRDYRGAQRCYKGESHRPDAITPGRAVIR